MYDREWNNNALEGYGIYYLKNGRVYLGQWKNNNKEGFGQYISEDKKYIVYMEMINKKVSRFNIEKGIMMPIWDFRKQGISLVLRNIWIKE